MVTETKIYTGNLEDIIIIDQDLKPIPLPQGINIQLKGPNILILITILGTTNKAATTGFYKITITNPT